jgi:hypothetical protein
VRVGALEGVDGQAWDGDDAVVGSEDGGGVVNGNEGAALGDLKVFYVLFSLHTSNAPTNGGD